MDHDITHCSGTDILFKKRNAIEAEHIVCDKRETCYRYKAYLDLENYKSHLVSMLMAESCVNKNHYMYWEDKE